MIGIMIGSLLGGAVLAFLTVLAYNILPPKWLCDYGENPAKLTKAQRTCTLVHALVLFPVYAGLLTAFFLHYTVGYALILAVLAALLLLVLLADAKTMIIPDHLSAGIALVGLVLAALDWTGKFSVFHESWWSPFLGMLIGFLFFFVIGLIGSIVTKQQAIGFGDSKLLGAIGFAVGVRGILIVLVLTLLLGLIVFGVLLLFKKLRRDQHTAFAPYICAAALLFLAFSPQIDWLIGAYFSLLSF